MQIIRPKTENFEKNLKNKMQLEFNKSNDF